MSRAFELNRALPRGLDTLFRGGEGNRVQGKMYAPFFVISGD